MKTPEELEKLADEKYLEKVEDINNSTIRGFIVSAVKGGFVEGYQQCQEDMADKEAQDKIKEHILNHANNQSPEDRLETELAAKKYTEEDLENAFNSGRGYGVPDNIKDFNSFIKSLNKKD